MQNILVPTDFSSNAMKAFCYAGEIAQKSGAHILLLHVIEPTADRIRQPHPLHEKLEKEIAEARNEELDIFQKSFASIYPGVNVRVVTAKGAAIPSIVEPADEPVAVIKHSPAACAIFDVPVVHDMTPVWLVRQTYSAWIDSATSRNLRASLCWLAVASPSAIFIALSAISIMASSRNMSR